MKTKKKKQEKPPTLKILGYKFPRKTIVESIVIGSLLIAGIYGYFHNKKMLEDSSITTGKIVWIGRTPGKRVGQPECDYEYFVNGQKIRRTSERDEEQDIRIGDCFEVKFSNLNPEVSKLNMEKGKILCKD